ncbi:MAG: hypothetical protein KJT03_22935, partial [Verrucomicrobiae bacterium]|nr:hypothetical protein [Verrucomicrobiae bacterium]
KDYEKKLDKLEDWQKELLKFAELAYVISVKNVGGMMMPLVIDIEFDNGSNRRLEIPVEIWRYGDETVKIPFLSKRKVVRVELDRDNAFADADLDNNVFPREIEEDRFKLKERKIPDNPMKKILFPGDENGKAEEEESN